MLKISKIMILVALILFVMSLNSLYAQRYGTRYGVTNVKVGYFGPKDAKGGIILGGMLGSAVDEAVDVGLGVDLFRGNNKKEVQTGSETVVGGLKEKASYLDSESSITLVPVTGMINIKIPASYDLYYTVGGGVGYEFLWTDEQEFDETTGKAIESESRFYHGFHWMITGGILYKLGARSSLILEAFYDGAELSREKSNITYKVNPSGFGIRTGVRFGIL
ncbi:hypothetical protein JXB12_12260 [candidate division KSB1 bacterium]|nr:hypothetical protein [candidate division KSB1 bacterium]